MITRSNLAEQLREFQIRSKHEWATVSYFSNPPTSTLYSTSSRVDVLSVIWELLAFALLIFSGVGFYFSYTKLAFVLLCCAVLNLGCMKITKQLRQNRKSKRRMLLPLSM